MERIICIYKKGFREISLPNGKSIEILSCDDGCFIETKNMDKDILELNKCIGLPIVDVYLDHNEISQGDKLGKCKIVTHKAYEYGYKCIQFSTESIYEDNLHKKYSFV